MRFGAIADSARGGPRRPPPSGIGDCSKTHLYIDLKVLDFSYIWKTKILKKKEIRFFYPIPPRRGVLKKWKFWKLVREPKLQNMICSTIKIRPAYKISVLYLQNQVSYSNFSLVNVMQNLKFTKFWNPEILLKSLHVSPWYTKKTNAK